MTWVTVNTAMTDRINAMARLEPSWLARLLAFFFRFAEDF